MNVEQQKWKLLFWLFHGAIVALILWALYESWYSVYSDESKGKLDASQHEDWGYLR